MSRPVIIAPRAEAQFRAIDEWWRQNRFAAQDLFAEEFRAAVEHIRLLPSLGARVEHAELRELPRLLLRATRYHLYYVSANDADEAIVLLAIWSAVRGSGPDLGSVGGGP